MPPLLPRSSVSGLSAALSSCSLRATTIPATAIPASSTWASRRRTTPSSSRAVSTSTAKPAPSTRPSRRPPPESPDFIRIPEVPQSEKERPARLKGHLPVPRAVFSKRDGNRKVLGSHFEKTVAVSAAEKAGLPPKSTSEARHRLLAAQRRAALKAGLRGLWERKEEREERRDLRNAVRQARHRAAATAPERADEVLTRGTVRAATADVTAVAPDPLRFEKAEAAAKRHAEKMALKAEQRRDALARLYVAAGDFIVDEDELEKRVNKIFSSNSFFSNSYTQGTNIWDMHGVPMSVAELKREMQYAQGTVGFSVGARSQLHKSTVRQKVVAEELTGGKL